MPPSSWEGQRRIYQRLLLLARHGTARLAQRIAGQQSGIVHDLENLGLWWDTRPHRGSLPTAQQARALQRAVNLAAGRGICRPVAMILGRGARPKHIAIIVRDAVRHTYASFLVSAGQHVTQRQIPLSFQRSVP